MKTFAFIFVKVVVYYNRGDFVTVGERIKKARKAKGLTQEELAKSLGVSFAMIGQYERGERNPKYETLQRIADALNVNIGVLLYGEHSTTIDSDGVRYSSKYIPQLEIDEDEEGIFKGAVKPVLCEVDTAFDEVTGNIIEVLQDMTEENKRLFLELAKKMSKKGKGEGGDEDE